MFTNIFSPEFYVTNGISLFVLIMAFRKPRLSRTWIALIMVSAAVANGVLVVRSPQSYLAFADVAVFDWYVRYINGPFSGTIREVVGTIAVLQMLAGLGMLYGGGAGKAAFIAAITFFCAIAPLGAGAAFPAPVLLAAACVVILLKWNTAGTVKHGKGRMVI